MSSVLHIFTSVLIKSSPVIKHEILLAYRCAKAEAALATYESKSDNPLILSIYAIMVVAMFLTDCMLVRDSTKLAYCSSHRTDF